MVVIFPKLCLWRRTLCSNVGDIGPEKLYRATLSLYVRVIYEFVYYYHKIIIVLQTEDLQLTCALYTYLSIKNYYSASNKRQKGTPADF